jgi:hypothetical protein
VFCSVSLCSGMCKCSTISRQFPNCVQTVSFEWKGWGYPSECLMSVGGYLLLPSGYTNKTVVHTCKVHTCKVNIFLVKLPFFVRFVCVPRRELVAVLYCFQIFIAQSDCLSLIRLGLPFRVLNVGWWLPSSPLVVNN